MGTAVVWIESDGLFEILHREHVVFHVVIGEAAVIVGIGIPRLVLKCRSVVGDRTVRIADGVKGNSTVVEGFGELRNEFDCSRKLLDRSLTIAEYKVQLAEPIEGDRAMSWRLTQVVDDPLARRNLPIQVVGLAVLQVVLTGAKPDACEIQNPLDDIQNPAYENAHGVACALA